MSSAIPRPEPRGDRPPEDLEPRLWVKLSLALLACGLLVGGGGRIFRWASHSGGEVVARDAAIRATEGDVAVEDAGGRIVRIGAAEGERVAAGRVLVEVDPVPYRERVERARARLTTAEAEGKRAEAARARSAVEGPLRVEVARRSLAAAGAERARADEAAKLAEIECERATAEATVERETALAERENSKKEVDRYAELVRQEAVPLRRAQEAVRALASADARLSSSGAKLARVEAERGRIAVARRAAEAAEATVSREAKALELAEAGAKDVEEANASATAAKSAGDEARLALAAAEAQLARTQVKAPFAGTVAQMSRRVGDYAAVGSTVATLYRPDAFHVAARLEASQLAGVSPGCRARIEVPGLPGPFSGRVSEWNRGIGTENGSTVPVRIVFDRDERLSKLRPGTAVRVTVERGPGGAE